MSFHSHFIVAVLFVCLFSCVASVSSVVQTSMTSKADAHPVPQPCRQVLIWDQLRGPDSCGYNNNNNNNNSELSWRLQESQVYVSSVYEWKSYFALFRCVLKAASRCTFCRCVCQLVARRRWWTAHDHVLGIFHWKHSRKHFFRVSVGLGVLWVSAVMWVLVCLYLERPDAAAWTAALRWISSEPERCSSGSLSPGQTGRTADPRSAWPALDTDTQTVGRTSVCAH